MLCTLLYTLCRFGWFTSVDNSLLLNEVLCLFLREEVIIVTFALL